MDGWTWLRSSEQNRLLCTDVTRLKGSCVFAQAQVRGTQVPSPGLCLDQRKVTGAFPTTPQCTPASPLEGSGLTGRMASAPGALVQVGSIRESWSLSALFLSRRGAQ